MKKTTFVIKSIRKIIQYKNCIHNYVDIPDSLNNRGNLDNNSKYG